MGHIISKDLYKKLGDKLSGNGSTVRAVNNKKFQTLLKSLYLETEAELAIKMPYNLSSIERVSKISGIPISKLEILLKEMARKGLVVDFMNKKGKYRYAASPIVYGFFEFTMMRTGKNLPYKLWAQLFNDYMGKDNSLYKANFSNHEISSLGRTIPYEEALKINNEESEILSYESVLSIIEKNKKFAVGICSCRHEKHHLGEKICDHSLENCLSLGTAADYLIRNELAKEVFSEEVKKIVAESKRTGLVFIGDNVKKNLSFICNCCKCCCNMLLGINKFGYLNTVTSSTYIANVKISECTGCKLCYKACPVNAIRIKNENQIIAEVDKDRCIGCGICATRCKNESIFMNKREKKVFHPEDFLEKALVANLEHGTLSNFIFDNPNSTSQMFLRVFLKSFLNLSIVKKTLINETLRSKFLEYIRNK